MFSNTYTNLKQVHLPKFIASGKDFQLRLSSFIHINTGHIVLACLLKLV